MRNFIKQKLYKINKLSVKVLLLTIIPIIVVLFLTVTLCTNSVSTNVSELVYQQLISKNIADCSTFKSLLSQNIVSISKESSDYSLERYLKTLSFGNNPETNPYHFQVNKLLDSIYESNPEYILYTWIVDYDSATAISNTAANWSMRASSWQIPERPWYKQSLTAQEAYITDLYSALYENTPVVSIVVPIKNATGTSTLGVLGVSFRLEYFRDAIMPEQNTDFSDNSCTMILDTEHTIVTSQEIKVLNRRLQTSEFSDISVVSDTDSEHIAYSLNWNGKDMVVVMSSLGIEGWRAFTVTPQTSIDKQIAAFTRAITIIIILSLAILVFSMGIISRIIAHPIKEVTEAAQEIAKGNYDVQLQTTSTDEIGELAEAVNTSITALRHRSLFDPLTEIYNSYSVENRVQYLLKKYPEKKYAIIRMDIANFKMVNDYYGSDAGDDLLRFIARILIDHVSPKDCYGRINRDVFCVCREYTTDDELIEFIDRITLHVKAYPIHFNLAPYFGIVINNYPDVSFSVLFDWAKLALNTVKGNSLLNYAFYEPQMRDALVERNSIEREMHSALSNREFQVYLQPKCNISNGTVVGAEALVRWVHPQKGLISPGLFIPLFEKNGFVNVLDEYVWEETCKIIRHWKDMGYPIVPISVNVSRTHIYDPDFVNKLTSLVEKYQIPMEALELEFTESAFVNDINQLYSTMNQLGDKGFVLSMDDFGSGYSSLNMLKNGPMDIVKIDQGFLNETLVSNSGKIIITNVISMINQLNKKIIAEGVETEEQATFLLSAGCSTAQGFYYSRPITLEAFEEFAFKRKENSEE